MSIREACPRSDQSRRHHNEYLTQLRTVSTTSGWVDPGAGRTLRVTGTVTF